MSVRTFGQMGAFRTLRRLPYDAEVEYLESTGTQWIDMRLRSLKVSSAFDMSMTVRFTAVPVSMYIGSGYTSTSGSQMFYALNFNQSTGLYMACNGRTNVTQNLSSDITAWHTCAAKTENGRVSYFFDSNLKSSFPFLGFTLPCFYLFAIGNSDFAISGHTGYQQISAARLSVDSEPVFDLASVRFTNEQGVSEGAMFDRANPTVGMNPDGSARTDGLYRNRGTGAFLYGNDLTTVRI